MRRRWRTALTGATAAGLIGLLAPFAVETASADPPSDLCIARDGEVIFQTGTAECFAAAGEDNEAIARGANSVAYVGGGVGNKAYANGDNTCALIIDTLKSAPTVAKVTCSVEAPPAAPSPAGPLGPAGYDDNRAVSTGDGSVALAIASSHSEADAHGAASVAVVSGGVDNKAEAEGDGSCALAGTGESLELVEVVCQALSPNAPVGAGVPKVPFPDIVSDHNEATAHGDSSVAVAGLGSGNEAMAGGLGSFALAGFGQRNVATAPGYCAVASAGMVYLFIVTDVCSRPVPPALAAQAKGGSEPGPCTVVEPYAAGDDNRASASGEGSFAFAGIGCENNASARGKWSVAFAGFGERNRASATAECSSAGAGVPGYSLPDQCNVKSPTPAAPAVMSGSKGSPCVISPPYNFGADNRATASAYGALASAIVGCRNEATASGEGSFAIAGEGVGNKAVASGDNSQAAAGEGNGNEATASGDSSYAFAGDGNNNKAKATRAGACAAAWSTACDPCVAPPVGAGDCTPPAAPLGSSSGLSEGSDYNVATASGIDSIAIAGPGDRNNALAKATSSFARAGDGDRNRAKALTASCSAVASGTRQTANC